MTIFSWLRDGGDPTCPAAPPWLIILMALSAVGLGIYSCERYLACRHEEVAARRVDSVADRTLCTDLCAARGGRASASAGRDDRVLHCSCLDGAMFELTGWPGERRVRMVSGRAGN